MNNYSSFWFDRNRSIDDILGFDLSTGEILDKPKPKKDHVSLAGHKRAIGNFVRIVSGENIPVTFATRGDSYTDGKKVTISGNINEKNFDHIVGLALHEGSHIAYSDFEIFKDVRNSTHIRSWDVTPERMEFYRGMINYIEDRRVDSLVFKSSPGYKGYYHSLYSKYFNHRNITKGLESTMYRDVDFESYMFRIINFTNKGTDLDSLPRLRDIYRKIDMKNILRLDTTEDTIEVAKSVCDIVFKMVGDNDSDGNGKDNKERKGGDDIDSDGSSGSGGDGEGTEVDTGDKGMSPDDSALPSNGSELSDNMKKSIEKLFEKEKELLDGNSKKTKLTKGDKKIVEALSNSKSELVETGDSLIGKVKTILIPELTKELIDSKAFPFLGKPWNTERKDTVINDGLRMGTILGKKLKVRGEERDLIYTRKDSGRINKRLIAELGFDNTNVFSQVFTERYNRANLHISIDASGSMNGKKLDKAMSSTVAMVKAADMAGNVTVVVSFRWTHNSKPVVIICYDSRKDKLNKIKKLWSSISAGGTTPESLCYEALMKNFLGGVRGEDNYFINYSDGAPYFSESDGCYYYGEAAENHTKKMVKIMKNNGIKVSSYFISSDYGYGSNGSDKSDFARMYGKDANFIDPTNMMEVARTMNSKFLEK